MVFSILHIIIPRVLLQWDFILNLKFACNCSACVCLCILYSQISRVFLSSMLKSHAESSCYRNVHRTVDNMVNFLYLNFNLCKYILLHSLLLRCGGLARVQAIHIDLVALRPKSSDNVKSSQLLDFLRKSVFYCLRHISHTMGLDMIDLVLFGCCCGW